MTVKIKIISGGQSGADLGGLCAAERFGLIGEFGGWMPVDFMTEDGPKPEYQSRFGMWSMTNKGLTIGQQYRRRSEFNVAEADVTFYFLLVDSKARSNAESDCRKHKKRFKRVRLWRNPDTGLIQRDWRDQPEDEVADWLKAIDAKVINIAGNRESKAPGIGVWVERYLSELFESLGYRKV